MNKCTTFLSDYERFCLFLLSDRPYLDPDLSFGVLCRRLGIRARTLDNILMSELGYHGQEIMENFRMGDIKNLLRLHN